MQPKTLEPERTINRDDKITKENDLYDTPIQGIDPVEVDDNEFGILEEDGADKDCGCDG